MDDENFRGGWPVYTYPHSFTYWLKYLHLLMLVTWNNPTKWDIWTMGYQTEMLAQGLACTTVMCVQSACHFIVVIDVWSVRIHIGQKEWDGERTWERIVFLSCREWWKCECWTLHLLWCCRIRSTPNEVPPLFVMHAYYTCYTAGQPLLALLNPIYFKRKRLGPALTMNVPL